MLSGVSAGNQSSPGRQVVKQFDNKATNKSQDVNLNSAKKVCNEICIIKTILEKSTYSERCRLESIHW